MARRFDVLLTASEAYPALEREFLAAQTDIIAGFRIFDPWTRLVSQDAKKIGTTWFDLLVDTLNRDVKITLTISDFDPVVRMDNHADTWASVRAIQAAGEASSNPHLLHVTASMHPARVGFLPRLALWPRLAKEIRAGLSDVNSESRDVKRRYLRRAPRLRPLVTWRGDKIVPRFAPPTVVPVTHHQKLAVFDTTRLYIGGLDLNNRRYDTAEHAQEAQDTWHDTQVIVDGPAAAQAAQHLREFEAVTLGKRPSAASHLLRTISAKRRFALPRLSPKPVLSEIADAHRDQISQASRLIYLESQFFRDRTLAEQMAQRARDQPALQLILILPAAPEEAAFEDADSSDVAYGEHLQTLCIKTVRQAFGPRVFIGSPAQPRAAMSSGRATLHGAPIIYLHAKVSVFDGQHGIVSSANLNGRSFAWDTEAGVATQSVDEAMTLQTRCFDHWLGGNAGSQFYDLETARQTWAARAEANANVPPDQRQGFLLPYDADPAAALASNLPGVPEEMV